MSAISHAMLMKEHTSVAPTVSVAESVAAGLLASAAIVAFGWVLYLCRAGIDFTDEGFYLNWLAHPDLYPASHTQFGFFYHPLYLLVGGDIALLRRLNLLGTFGCAVFLFSALLRSLDMGRIARSALVIALAAGVLTHLGFWLPTPNYNTLSLQGLLLAATALTLVDSRSARVAITAAVMLGISGWITFMAKPTSGALLAVLATAYLGVCRIRYQRWIVAMSTAAVMLIATAWFIDGSILMFVHRLQLASADMIQFQGGYSLRDILRVDRFSLSRDETLSFAVTVAFTALIPLFAMRSSRWLRAAAVVIALGALAGGWILGWDRFRPRYFYSAQFGLQFLALPLGCTLAVAVTAPRRLISRTVALAALLLLLPGVQVFGTNVNYWLAMGRSAVFWSAAAVAIASFECGNRHAMGRLLPLGIATIVGTWAVIRVSEAQPYRMPLRLSDCSFAYRLPANGAMLRIPAATASYLSAIDSTFIDNGFRRGEGVIDLTGRFPTTLHVIGARPLGLAWVAGGYRGSEALAETALRRVPRSELEHAWLLLEPGGPRSLHPEILLTLGLDWQRDYVEVGKVLSPAGEYPSGRQQIVLKPRCRINQ